jgi:CRISPR-associated RAMP protein, Csm3 family
MSKQIKLIGYVTIKGVIECLTGIHVGGTADSIDKGGIDNPIIKNPVTNEPYIPGSSLRGRIRSILEKALGKKLDKLVADIHIHRGETDTDSNSCEICRMFGTTTEKHTIPSTLIVRDCLLHEDSRNEYMDGKLPITEAKMETAIDRITSAAHPRTIERVPAGAKFDFELIYKVQSDEKGDFSEENNSNLKEDIKLILLAMELIEKKCGLGGNTSRGYGQVRFIVETLDAKEIDLKTDAFADVAENSKHGYDEENTNYDGLRTRVGQISYPDSKSDDI